MFVEKNTVVKVINGVYSQISDVESFFLFLYNIKRSIQRTFYPTNQENIGLCYHR